MLTARTGSVPPAVLFMLVAVSGCTPSVSASDVNASSTLSTSVPSSSAAPSPSRTPAAVAATSARPPYLFPVSSKTAKFGRAHHDYPATDIFAPCGTSVVAPTGGTISEVTRTDHWSARKNDGGERGGLSISIVGTDGVRYYGSHLRSIASSIAAGRQVQAGEVLGKVGNTGDARGLACHLHFGLSPACGKGDWWVRRGVVSPYPFLKAWQAGKQPGPSPVKSVSDWRAEHGCPKAPRADP